MLKTLVKKQLMEIFRSYFYNAKTNKKRSTAGIIAYILLFAALMIGLGGMFTGLSAARHLSRRVRQRVQHVFGPVLR